MVKIQLYPIISDIIDQGTIMEIEISTLRKVYDHLKFLVKVDLDSNIHDYKESAEALTNYSKKHVVLLSIAESGLFSFPKTFSVRFEDLPDVFKELEKRGLIKYDRTYSHVKDSATQRYEQVHAYSVIVLKLVDSEIEFKEDNPHILSFRPQLCSLEYNGTYNPHKKDGRCKILKELWNSRTVEGRAKKSGVPNTIDELIIIGGYENMQSVRDAIRDIRMGIKKIGAQNQMRIMPLGGGYILIVKEQKAT